MGSLEELRVKYAASRRAILICAAVTIFAGILFSGWGNILERSGFDLFSRLAPGSVPGDLIIVGMDDEAYKSNNVPIGQTWPRALHAKLLDHLAKEGARLAVFDSYFRSDSPNVGEDERFAEAIENFKKVGDVAAAVWREQAPGSANWRNVMPEVLEKAFGKNLGDHKLDPEIDEGVGNWIRHPRELSDFPSLAWVAAKACNAPVTRNPRSRLVSRWIKYYGPANTLRYISYGEVWTAPRDYFRNKYVFIGVANFRSVLPGAAREEFGTPFTRVDRKFSPGVEIHATIFLNLLHNQWINDLGGLHYLLLFLAGFCMSVLLIPPKSIREKLLFAGFSAVAFFGFAFLLFWVAELWIDWPVLVGVQMPAALATSLVFYAIHKEGRTTIEKPPPWPPPNFDLIKPIGEGSFGEVWLVRGVTGAYVALKKVDRKMFPEEAPFSREFTGVSNFFPICREHPNWVCVLHVGEDKQAGFFYYAMEAADDVVSGQKIDPAGYLPKTLKSLLEDGRWLPVRDCVEAGLALADAVEALHNRGFIHRDIKPSNIVYVKNVPKLADIGLVVRSDQTVSFLGTEGYIPPERVSSRSADIYALGIVLYQGATGALPRDYPALPTFLMNRSDAREVILLLDIVNKACEPKPKDRYQTAAELRDDLKRLRATLHRSGGRKKSEPRMNAKGHE